jgi:signal transduction histidine kinase
VRLRTQLAASYLLVVLVCGAATALLAWLAVEQVYRQTQSANLLAQAQLIAAALANSPLQPSQPAPYSQLSNTIPGIRSRVIDAQTAAVIDLPLAGEAPPPGAVTLPQLAQNAAGNVSPEELFARPEIQQARQGQAATAIRRVDVAGGKPVLYAAAPVTAADGAISQVVYLATPLPDITWSALPLAVRWQLVGAFFAAALLAGGVGLLLAWRIARPLGRVADAARAVAGGDLDQAVPEPSGPRELADLGRSFNAMTASLRQSDQAKNAFVADVSHELRTPLTVIKGTIETLQDGALDDPSVRDGFLDAMSQETERLIRLVNDLLVLARADAGALNLRLEPVDLADLARTRCAGRETLSRSRGVRLVVETVSPASGEVAFLALADPDRIARVLDNLLDNAIRYSPPGGEVKVALENDGDWIACRMSDAGPGIRPEERELIFERFYRADPARDRDRGGSGLGLAIVRGLVAAHGGRVEAQCRPGSGATLAFWLPACRADTDIPIT